MNYTPYKLYPQALLAVYITLRSESESNGGASMRNLKAAYESIVGRIPCDRTIQRILERIDDTLSPDRPAIKTRTRGSIIRYYLEEDNYVLQRFSGL